MEKGKGQREFGIGPELPLFTFLFFSFFLLSACGSPGEPVPPRPVVPAAITDLAARQQGNRVLLTFTLPTRSATGDALAAPPDVEMYRGFATSGVALAAGPLVLTIPAALVETYARDGFVEFADPVKPEDIAAHRGELWVYAVRTRVSPRQASASSNLATVRVLPAPPAVIDISATITEAAIDLRWQAVAGAVGYRVFRAEEDGGAAAVPGRFPAPVLAGVTPVAAYRDTQFEFGRRYVYTVRTVAQAEGAAVESDPSAPASVLAADTFPPGAPPGLVVVAVAATGDTPPHLELSWGISAENDLAGYHVYRSHREDTQGERVTRELLFVPTFRDTSVTPGRRYFYRVTALDRLGNESAPSPPVGETVPERPRG